MHPEKSRYEGILTGEQLHPIAKAGWNKEHGCPIIGMVTSSAANPHKQILRIGLPWPPPEPHAPDAPLFIWLEGENSGASHSRVCY